VLQWWLYSDSTVTVCVFVTRSIKLNEVTGMYDIDTKNQFVMY